MTVTEYQLLAARTCNDLGSLQENTTHMKLGIYTEIGELLDVFKKHLAYGKPIDVVNVGEEIADCMFYVANWANLYNTSLADVKSIGEFLGAPTLQSCIKRCELILESTITATYIFSFAFGLGYVTSLLYIAKYFDLDFEKILQNNIDKLRVRYPEKFDADKALNRNLDRERTELEK